MSEVASAYVSLLPSARGFGRGLEKQVGGEVSGVGKRLGGMLAAGMAAAAGGGAVAFLTTTIGAASDLQQSIGGVEAVFGEYADEVEKDSARAAKALGLSKNSYNELITISGAMLKNKGLSNFADQSEKLVGLGADLAATFGGSTREAVEALNAAFRGESDPIERYGVSLNESAVNAELLAKGQDKLTGSALDQAKAQARLSILFKQTKDAQGGAAREADTFAAKQQQLTAAWENQRAEIGEKFLPVATQAIGFLSDTAVPAIGAAADAASGLFGAFGDLPAPIQAATGALVAFRVAQAAGLTGSIASTAAAGLASIGSGMDSVRLRGMLAADTYREMRSAQLNFVKGAPQFVGATGRVSAGLGAIRTAGAGAGSGLRKGLSGALGVLGGPWGAALIGGTALLTHFWKESEKAKGRVDTLTGALDQNTGAITKNAEAELFKILQEEGAIKGARELGISLDKVRAAATGDADSLAEIRAQLDGMSGGEWKKLFGNDKAQAAYDLGAGLNAVGAALDGAKQDIKDAGEFSGKAAGSIAGAAAASVAAAGAVAGYGRATNGAKRAVQGLTKAEEERANAAIKRRRDNIALRQTLRDVQKEAREGAKSLDTNTQAGADNMSALLDLGEQWQQSSGKVRAANGGYKQMRQTFIALATQMGADQTQARNLANEILGVPDRKPRVDVKGIPAALGALAGFNRTANNATRDRNMHITVTASTSGALAGALIGGSISGRFVANGAGRAVTPPPEPVERTAAGGGHGRLTITNWRDGTGYFETVADDRIYANGALGAESVRAR